MLLYLCPFAGRWHFGLLSAVPPRNLSCSPGLFCTHTNRRQSVLKPPLRFIFPQRLAYLQDKEEKLTYGTSWGLLCNSHHPLWQPHFPEPSGSSGQQPDLCLQTCNILNSTEPTEIQGGEPVLYFPSWVSIVTVKKSSGWLVILPSKRSTVWKMSVLVTP